MAEIVQSSIPDKTLADGGHWACRPVRCSSCGGLHPFEVIRLLRTNGTKFSSEPWRDGWPHRYNFEVVGQLYTFYTIHLRDTSPAEFLELACRINRIFGVLISREGSEIQYFAPPAIRRLGIIWGEIVNGEPDFSAMNMVNGRKK